jgi:hypothetical protein
MFDVKVTHHPQLQYNSKDFLIFHLHYFAVAAVGCTRKQTDSDPFGVRL